MKNKLLMKAQAVKPKIHYDGQCGFCQASIRLLKALDKFGSLEYISTTQGLTEMRIDLPDGRSFGGFLAFRKLVLIVPMLYPLIIFAYFPGSGIVGPYVYRWIAARRHHLPGMNPYVKGKCHR